MPLGSHSLVLFDTSTGSYDTVEVEAILEVNEEELYNIMRLNSLLRFLVIGEKAECSDCKDENKGSCTWVTRRWCAA